MLTDKKPSSLEIIGYSDSDYVGVKKIESHVRLHIHAHGKSQFINVSSKM
jgi:hypothetical protein